MAAPTREQIEKAIEVVGSPGLSLRRQNLGGLDLLNLGLAEADLGVANLRKANLAKANLEGADLRGANLTSVNLNGTRYDAETKWPPELNPSLTRAVFDAAARAAAAPVFEWW